MGGIQARKSAHISSQPREDKTKEREIVSTRGYVSRPGKTERSLEPVLKTFKSDLTRSLCIARSELGTT